MSTDRRPERPVFCFACRRGWRKAIRRMMRNITPKHVSKLEALHQSGTGNVRLEAGQRFGAVRKEAVRPASRVEPSIEQLHGQPATSGRE